jgi:hypothetical protein
MSGELVFGSISKDVFPGGANQPLQWRWHFHVTAVPPRSKIHGSGDSLEEVKSEIERNWQLWFKAAGLSDAESI